LHTSGEPVDSIERFNVSPFDGYGRGRVLNPQVRLGYTIRCSVRHPAKLALPVRVFAADIDVDKGLVTPNAATE
jgi:hypothetical protein